MRSRNGYAAHYSAHTLPLEGKVADRECRKPKQKAKVMLLLAEIKNVTAVERKFRAFFGTH